MYDKDSGVKPLNAKKFPGISSFCVLFLLWLQREFVGFFTHYKNEAWLE